LGTFQFRRGMSQIFLVPSRPWPVGEPAAVALKEDRMLSAWRAAWLCRRFSRRARELARQRRQCINGLRVIRPAASISRLGGAARLRLVLRFARSRCIAVGSETRCVGDLNSFPPPSSCLGPIFSSDFPHLTGATAGVGPVRRSGPVSTDVNRLWLLFSVFVHFPTGAGLSLRYRAVAAPPRVQALASFGFRAGGPPAPKPGTLRFGRALVP